MKKLICFDVDGVLIESSREIMLSSWNEYNAWLADRGLAGAYFCQDIAQVPDAFRQARTALAQYSHKGYYRVAINLFILAGFNPDKVSIELIRQISEADPELKTATMARLKRVRDQLFNEVNLQTLIRPYAEVDYDWLYEKYQQGEVFFVTNNAYSPRGFSAIAFSPDEYYVRRLEGGVHDKAHHINDICRLQEVPTERVLFVDDSVASLQDVKHGTTLPSDNILQNTWCEKPQATGFQQVSWAALVSRFEAL